MIRIINRKETGRANALQANIRKTRALNVFAIFDIDNIAKKEELKHSREEGIFLCGKSSDSGNKERPSSEESESPPISNGRKENMNADQRTIPNKRRNHENKRKEQNIYHSHNRASRTSK